MYMKKIKILFKFVLSMFLIPFATVSGAPYFGAVDTFFIRISGFIGGVLIPLVFSLALLFFVYGMFRYFIQGGANEEERTKGKSMILWSIIGFVLMVSIWGIVNLLAGGLFGNTQPPILPGTPAL